MIHPRDSTLNNDPTTCCHQFHLVMGQKPGTLVHTRNRWQMDVHPPKICKNHEKTSNPKINRQVESLGKFRKYGAGGASCVAVYHPGGHPRDTARNAPGSSARGTGIRRPFAEGGWFGVQPMRRWNTERNTCGWLFWLADNYTLYIYLHLCIYIYVCVCTYNIYV